MMNHKNFENRPSDSHSLVHLTLKVQPCMRSQGRETKGNQSSVLAGHWSTPNLTQPSKPANAEHTLFYWNCEIASLPAASLDKCETSFTVAGENCAPPRDSVLQSGKPIK